MTSRSLRKHQTTRPSILRNSGLLALGLTLLAGACGMEPVSAADPGGFLSNPLKKLLNRDPEKRANELMQSQLQAEQQRRSSLPPRVMPVQSSGLAPEFPDSSSPITPVGGVSAEADLIEASYDNTTSDPRNLKKITAILPYADYQPELQVETTIDPELQAPEEVALGTDPIQPRQMEAVLYQWQASNLHHNPLYFEDPSLERYGHTYHPLVQPLASVGRMGIQTIGLPYQMTIDPVWKKRYTLGWYRAGDCAPKVFPTIPWNTKAAINQAAVVTGMFYVLP